MATVAHCLYCFEVLAANLEYREPLTLRQVEESWDDYNSSTGATEGKQEYENGNDDQDGEMTEGDGEEETEELVGGNATSQTSKLHHRDMAKLKAPSPASNASTPSTFSTTSSSSGIDQASKSSSKSSLSSILNLLPTVTAKKEEEHPLFVTWNTVTAGGYRNLRGCVGTFEAQPLSKGLASYALTSALDDVRFSPITLAELPTLSNAISLLMNFTPCANPLDWVIGTHGLRISFSHHSKRYNACYLPDIAEEQGWTKEETIASLLRKAGYSGRSNDWKKMSDLRCVRFEGLQATVGYSTWKEWRKWVRSRALR